MYNHIFGKIFLKSTSCIQSNFLLKIGIMVVFLSAIPLLTLAQFADGDGSEGNPYQITTWEHLNNVRDYLDDNFILMNDLDENSDGYDEYASSAANDGKGWDPIGTSDVVEGSTLFFGQPFEGTFDGDGHTIRDLFINRPSETEVGLFRKLELDDFFDTPLNDVNDGVIQNLTIEDADIFGGLNVGIAVGENEGVIINVHTSGEVAGVAGIGGLAGKNSLITLKSSSSANVIVPILEFDDVFSSLGENAFNLILNETVGYGGLAGSSSGIIAFSNASGFVGITDEDFETIFLDEDSEILIDPALYGGTGGLVGTSLGSILISYATGDVHGLFGSGGLVGINGPQSFINGPQKSTRERSSTISTPFNFETLAADISIYEDYFEDLEEGEIRNAYATGVVKGFFFAGGLLGINSGGLVSNTYSAGEVIFWPFEFEQGLEEDFPAGDINENFAIGGLIGFNSEEEGGPPPIFAKSTGEFNWNDINDFAQNGIILQEEPDNNNVRNSFWDIQSTRQDTSSGGTGKSTGEMREQDTFTNTSNEGLEESWDFNNLWTIRTGEFISYPFFGNDENAPEQDPPPGLIQIGGSDRLLAGAGQETVIPASLFKFDGDDQVIIISIPSRGLLLLNDEEVENFDIISKSEIESGNLTFEPENDSDITEYGYDYTSFEYQASASRRTLNIDLAARAISYSQPEGWFLFSAPAIGQTVADLLGGIRTDGFPGSDNPGASFPTVYTLDQEAYEWEAVGSADQELEQGEALLVYIFGEDTPKSPMLSSNGPWAPLNGDFNYDEILGYDPNQGAFGDSHFLIGNPHPVGIDICNMLVEGENIATSFDIWLPSENAGNGGYVNISCSIPAKEVQAAFDERANQLFAPPFAGFWVRTTDENPSLDITDVDYQRYDQRVSKEKRKYEPLTLLLNHNEREYKEVVHILFSDEAEIGLDRIDATKLSSAGLAERYLSFFAMDQENRAYALRSLPEQIRELIIPLGIETTEKGSFTLDWNLPSEAGLSYSLLDIKTGEEFSLENGSVYQFSISEDEITKMTEKQISNATLGSGQKTDSITPRFELIIHRKGANTPEELPSTITLDQNYPNPFNPSTVIRYQLPEAAQVSLEVFDMAGRKVADLVNGQVSAGSHTVNFDASQLSSGIYMYRLQTGSTTLTRKLTVVK